MGEYKQVIIVRQDLKLPKGKCAVQCSHAAVEAVLISDSGIVKKWRKEGMEKIIVKVKNLKELRNYNNLAKQKGLVTAIITDAGKTTVAPGTVTCAAAGPALKKDIDEITANLKLL